MICDPELLESEFLVYSEYLDAVTKIALLCKKRGWDYAQLRQIGERLMAECDGAIRDFHDLQSKGGDA